MKKQETLRAKFYYGREVALKYKNLELIYAIGFYAGQMEKVVSGACDYCMFRPELKDLEIIEEIIEELTKKFDLDFCLHDNEFWIFKYGNESSLLKMKEMTVNSDEYHVLRAKMCGITEEDIDPQYHLRDGHDEYKKT